jgi:hypothetical protein
VPFRDDDEEEEEKEKAEAVPSPRPAKARQGFFGTLFTKLFSGAEEDKLARPAPQAAARTEAGQPAGPRHEPAAKPESAGQPPQRREADGAGRSARGRRGGKKNPPRAAEDRGRPEGKKKSKKKPRKKTSRKKGGEARQDAPQTAQPAGRSGEERGRDGGERTRQPSAGQEQRREPTAGGDAERTDQDKRQERGDRDSRRGRRRRSPYQTSGAKQREDGADGAPEGGPDSGPKGATDSGPNSGPNSGPESSKPREQSAAQADGGDSESGKPRESAADSRSGGHNGGSRGVTDRPSSGATASQPAPSRADRAAVEVTQDSRGIYTMKPREPQSGEPANQRPAPGTETKTQAAETADSA